DTKARALVHRQFGDVVAVEFDAAAIGRNKAGDHVEHGGLAGAVWPEQTDRFAAPDVEARASDHLAAAEALFQAVRGQITVRIGAPHRPGAGAVLAHAARRWAGRTRRLQHRALDRTQIHAPAAGRRLALARGSLASEQGKNIGEHTSLSD